MSQIVFAKRAILTPFRGVFVYVLPYAPVFFFAADDMFL
jgi:hypothetical protein